MKYCLPYIKNFKYIDELDEIIIPYSSEDVFFLNTLLSKDKILSKRLIIDIQDLNDFKENYVLDFFLGIKKDYPDINFTLRFLTYSPEDQDIYEKLKQEKIPFFFEKYVKDWDMFDFFKKLGVSDMYIVEALAFELNKIGAQADVSGISIRCFANVCQSSVRDDNSLKSFFIRPEDIPIYEQYVDVIEFYGDVNFQSTTYKIYAHDKHWFGPLKEFLIGFELDLDSRFIPKVFAEARIACGKKCLKGHPCQICEKTNSLASSLKALYVSDDLKE